jgi:hypothetical protein
MVVSGIAVALQRVPGARNKNLNIVKAKVDGVYFLVSPVFPCFDRCSPWSGFSTNLTLLTKMDTSTVLMSAVGEG